MFFILIKVCFIKHLKDYETKFGHNSCLAGLKCVSQQHNICVCASETTTCSAQSDKPPKKKTK